VLTVIFALIGVVAPFIVQLAILAVIADVAFIPFAELLTTSKIQFNKLHPLTCKNIA